MMKRRFVQFGFFLEFLLEVSLFQVAICTPRFSAQSEFFKNVQFQLFEQRNYIFLQCFKAMTSLLIIVVELFDNLATRLHNPLC